MSAVMSLPLSSLRLTTLIMIVAIYNKLHGVQLVPQPVKKLTEIYGVQKCIILF